MALLSYKCPNCGGGLKFDAASQKLKCEFCLSVFTEEEIEKMEPVASVAGDASGAADSSGTGDAVIYTCPSCGAEVVTDATTAATFCYYCHNPVVLSGRLSGEFLPDYVLPFAVDKKKATEIFLSWISKKKFVPKTFFSKDQIEKFTGVYFPYLIYSCQVDGRLRAEADQTVRSWTTGNIRYTEHKKFQVEREGQLDVKNVARNALSKNDRALIESVLPFDMEKLAPFQLTYLTGFQAEKRDMEGTAFEAEVEEEVRAYTIQSLTSSVSGYSSVDVKNSETRIQNARWQYALLPVWVMTYRDKRTDKVYYFAMNGQTGKTCGRLPVDKGKLASLFAGIFVPLFTAVMIGAWFL